MKKFLSFMLAAVMLLSLAACRDRADAGASPDPSETISPSETPSVKPSETPSTAPSETPSETPSEEPSESPSPEPSEEPAPVYELSYVYGFSNGWAPIEFRDDSGNYYYGVIDASGKLHSYFNSSSISADYTNGSGHYYRQKSQTYYAIGPEGQVHTYPEVQEVYSSNRYSGGYRYVVERKSGFEAVEYVTHVYDPDGTELTSFSGSPNYIYYAGDGVFLFSNSSVEKPASSRYQSGYDLYFAQSNTWRKEQVVSDTYTGLNTYRVRDGIFVFRCNSNSGRYDGDNGEVTYADLQGNLHTITVPTEYGADPYYLYATDGILLFTDTKTNAIYCYNTKTDQWTSYQGSYQNNLYNITSNDSGAVAGDGHFTLSLRGADGKSYWVLLNDKLEDLTQPTLGTVSKIENGVVYVTTNGLECYDYTGSLINTFASNFACGEGIVCVDYGTTELPRGYYKADGTPAFEIDFSTGVEVTELP